MIHTLKQANDLLDLLKPIDGQVYLIGSVAENNPGISEHDIDIVMPGIKLTNTLEAQLCNLLQPIKVSYTDWGGIFMHQTKLFGNVDIFFEQPTS